MFAKFNDYQKVLKNEQFHRQVQTVMMAEQMALVDRMADSLEHLQSVLRQSQFEGLAVQQAMLIREKLQDSLEEFIYNTEKMVQSFSEAEAGLQPPAQYFALLGVKEEVQRLRIDTILIRGRDNKAAFESAMEQVAGLLGQLKNNSEVIDALVWVASEEQRVADERRQQASERHKLLAQQQAVQNARSEQLRAQIRELKASRACASFSDWYAEKFGNFLNRKPPYESLPLLKLLQSSTYRTVAPVLLWRVPAPLGVCGFIWIPLWFCAAKKKIEAPNASINRQIADLERDLAVLDAPLDISIVKSARIDDSSEATLGELVASYLGTPTWTADKSNTGQRFVNCRGSVVHEGKRAEAVLQFFVVGDRCDLHAVEINGVPQKTVKADFYRKLHESYQGRDSV